jgi:beta-lactam-binding protein with PASTA domain
MWSAAVTVALVLAAGLITAARTPPVAHGWGANNAVQVGDRAPLALQTPIPTPTPVRVPNLIGSTAAGAANRLQAVGLVLGSKVFTPDDRFCSHIGEVVNQSPPSGTVVPVGSKVDIAVAGRPSGGCP